MSFIGSVAWWRLLLVGHGAITFDMSDDEGDPGEYAVGQPSGETLFWWRKNGVAGRHDNAFGTEGKGARGSSGAADWAYPHSEGGTLNRLGSMMESWRESAASSGS